MLSVERSISQCGQRPLLARGLQPVLVEVEEQLVGAVASEHLADLEAHLAQRRVNITMVEWVRHRSTQLDHRAGRPSNVNRRAWVATWVRLEDVDAIAHVVAMLRQRLP